MMETYQAHETAVIDEGCSIGEGTRIWHFSHIMKGCTIGRDCTIGQNVVISPDVVIGSRVKIQNNVSVYTGVICEDDVFLGPSCVFTNVINPRSAISRKHQYQSTYVEKGATIGANATIICGNRVGRYAMVGAGTVITKDVPPFALVVGNPARRIGWVSEYGHRLKFSNEGVAICPESDAMYHLRDGKVVRSKEVGLGVLLQKNINLLHDKKM
jgi:UDP-2-acetamido-3-amino-2,3-dideoxy-glucuronate N-acetyltransferase